MVVGSNKILFLPSNFFSSNSDKKIVGETIRTQYNYVRINVDEIVKYLYIYLNFEPELIRKQNVTVSALFLEKERGEYG